MTQKTWTLTDDKTDTYVDTISVDSSHVGGKSGDYVVQKRRLQGGIRDGVDLIEIDNGRMSISVVPTRGMGVWRARSAPGDIGWQSPIRGPVHPRWVPLAEPGGLGWLDGFDELLVRCGLESNGAPDFDSSGRLLYPLHGRIANRPAHLVTLSIDGDEGQIELTGVVDETRFLFGKLRLTSTIRTHIGQPGFRVVDQVENVSDTDAELQLLYHINFGSPLLEPGARVLAPIETLVPRDPRAAEGIAHWSEYGPPTAGSQEQVYFARLLADSQGRTQTLLTNADSTWGVTLDFSVQQLPCFTLWKNEQGMRDGYVTGLEPGTNFPNPRSYELQQGRVISLPPGGTASFELGLTVHASPDDVRQSEEAIALLQGNAAPNVLSAPQPGWCVL